MSLKSVIVLFAAAALTYPVVAQSPPPKTVIIKFPRGASETTIRGNVRGYGTVDYIVGARAGQRMTVALISNNGSNQFNVTAPNAEEAMAEAIGVTNFTGRLPATGNYVVRVYLMRNEARRGVAAAYTLRIGVDR